MAAVFSLQTIPPIVFKWRTVADSESPETHEFDPANSQVTMTIDVDLSDPKPPTVQLSDVIADIIGFPTVYWPTPAQFAAANLLTPAQGQGYVGGLLSRKLPWQHPRFPQLWCTKIGTIQGRQFKAKKWTMVKALGYPGVGNAGAVGMTAPYSEYSYYRMNLAFTCPPYNVLSDSQVGLDINNLVPGEEWLRYLTIEADTGEENLIRPGSTLRWARYGGSLPPGTVPTTPIAQGAVVRTPKVMYTWTWHQVPGVGLMGTSGWGRPRNLINGIGKVNLAPWPPNFNAAAQWPAGTLLFLKPKWIAENAPVPASLLGVPGFQANFTPRTYRVVMPVIGFDPDPSPGTTLDNNPWPRPGHQGAPLPGTPYHYLLTTDKVNNSSNRNSLLYKVYEFEKLFALNYPSNFV